VLVLPSELTHKQASACLRMLVQGLPSQTGPAVLVDAASLERFDSSALAVLLEFRRASVALGKGFDIRGLSPRLIDLARLYGVAELLVPAA
jgi:phospholipid transport system transporter-binding protein